MRSVRIRTAAPTLCWALCWALYWGAATAEAPEPPATLPAAAAVTQPSAPAAPDYGLNEPFVAVDRFSDEAATDLRRRTTPGLPGPNESIDLDQPPFRRTVRDRSGREHTCYDLDRRPATAPRYYVFYDGSNNYLLTQFPIIDVLPGQPGYSDVWDVWRVVVPRGFKEDNHLRDRATVEKLLGDLASGFTAQRTGVLINAPVVPEGSRAGLRADQRQGGAPLRYAWYRGKRAPYLYFEGSIASADGIAPIATLTIPAPGGVPVVSATPGAPGYSPLWRIERAENTPDDGNPLNCPIVGE